MNETTILLSSGNPKAEPDFLATVEPALIPRLSPPPFVLPFELVIDEYTREPWSSGRRRTNDDPCVAVDENENDDDWRSFYLVSTDGRNRLGGFMDYLRERKKAAVARFEMPIDANANAAEPRGGRAVLVVPYDPPSPVPRDDLPEGVDPSRVLFVKYLRDENILLGRRDRTPHAARTEQQKSSNQAEKTKQQQQQPQPQQQQRKQNQTRQEIGSRQQQRPTGEKVMPKPTRTGPSSSVKGAGLLGNLLGAQRRTEDHLDLVRAKKATSTNDSSSSFFDDASAGGAAGCINSFRAKISSDLEAFKIDRASFSTRIRISLSSLVRSVPPDERDGMTMDVFRFAVYEQVEEVGMDRWVAAKEPSEFIDECVIVVYKEGHCPKEVLEDMNRGELPDEVKGRARHIVESQSRAIQRKGKKMDERMVKDTTTTAEDVVVLNTNKRDRRTLEQIQKDLLDEDEEIKRSRFET